jgi:uncharacterized ferritin-like protein (DUF455 family)
VLETAEPAAKVALSQSVAAAWRRGEIAEIGGAAPPERPARPTRPLLLAPRDMPKRRAGTAHCAAARAGAYRAQRHRSRLEHHRPLQWRDLAARLL